MKKVMALVVLFAVITSSATVAGAAEDKGKRLMGQLIHIEGWHYTIKDNTGQEVSFGVTDGTKQLTPVKEGDFVVAMIGDDNIATSIKNLKKSAAPAQPAQ